MFKLEKDGTYSVSKKLVNELKEYGYTIMTERLYKDLMQDSLKYHLETAKKFKEKAISKYPKPDVFDTTHVDSESFKLLDWIKKQIEDSQAQTDRWKQLEKVVSTSIEREYEKYQK